jgi:hypothetical protein
VADRISRPVTLQVTFSELFLEWLSLFSPCYPTAAHIFILPVDIWKPEEQNGLMCQTKIPLPPCEVTNGHSPRLGAIRNSPWARAQEQLGAGEKVSYSCKGSQNLRGPQDFPGKRKWDCRLGWDLQGTLRAPQCLGSSAANVEKAVQTAENICWRLKTAKQGPQTEIERAPGKVETIPGPLLCPMHTQSLNPVSLMGMSTWIVLIER